MIRRFSAYAPPVIYGAWQEVAAHIGSVTYTITVAPVGDTLLMGEVMYFKGTGAGTQTVESIVQTATITTSDSVATVKVIFKGVPTGTAVDGTITP